MAQVFIAMTSSQLLQLRRPDLNLLHMGKVRHPIAGNVFNFGAKVKAKTSEEDHRP